MQNSVQIYLSNDGLNFTFINTIKKGTSFQEINKNNLKNISLIMYATGKAQHEKKISFYYKNN